MEIGDYYLSVGWLVFAAPIIIGLVVCGVLSLTDSWRR